MQLEKNDPSNTVLKLYWLPTIKAAIELNGEQFSSSSGASGSRCSLRTRRAATIPAGHPVSSLHARPSLPDGAQRQRAAAAEFQKFLDHRGIVLNFPLGALAHLGLARAYALSGDTAKAEAAYQDFFALWKDADPDIPILKEAKAEYAKLQ